ncbi:MAG: hypothetical protein ACAH59_06420 [Pseudobdellovibrionaceae bacterium]
MSELDLAKRQKNMRIVKASMFLGTLMCLGFVYVMFELMGL